MSGVPPSEGTVGDLAQAVKTRRRYLNLRQEELADLAGVSERFVYALESGKQTVHLDKVIAVLAALGLHLELHRGEADGIRSNLDGRIR